MSMALTSTPHRHRGPRRSLGIPTIPAGHVDGGTSDVSAVDTELLTCSTSRGLGREAARPHLPPPDSRPAPTPPPPRLTAGRPTPCPRWPR
ncbi:hypothetical protein BKH28_05895 [Actinomyces oris]|uniref:Uncharacterized protein n=1 Tax=Actinomyces oris TaxID=544580 RepID=A0A1Q8VNU2_9ACTO|nr:hypothetical protein BKH28_05895 [Actinomyces oris]